jgi:CheY-like chemotaxis protein
MTAALILLALAAVALAIVKAVRRSAGEPESEPVPATPEVGTLMITPAAPPVVEPPRAEDPAPVAVDRPEPVAAEPKPDATPASPSTVLVVDDETAVRSSTARLLARAGYQVLQASSAHEALAVVHSKRTIDAMLSDVVMPGANGFELASAVRDISPSTAIVLFTAYTPAAIDRHNLRGASEARLLQKPLERHELLDAIAAAIAEA